MNERDEARARALLTLIRDSSSVQDDIDAVLAFERRAKAEALREVATTLDGVAESWRDEARGLPHNEARPCREMASTIEGCAAVAERMAAKLEGGTDGL
jgi:hypothetical protein